MPVGVSRWWQELMHPCKHLKNNNWRTSRSLPTYLTDNSNNSQGLATQQQSLSHQWSSIDTSSRSAIHMSQLRQPGDYLKYNRAGTLPPCVHMFTAETNEKKRKVLNRKDLNTDSRRERTKDTERLRCSTTEHSCALTTRENRHCIKTEKWTLTVNRENKPLVLENRNTPLSERNSNREQHRCPNESHGWSIMHRKWSQPRAGTRRTRPSHEPHGRPTQDQGGSHQGVCPTTRHYCPWLVCMRLL